MSKPSELAVTAHQHSYIVTQWEGEMPINESVTTGERISNPQAMWKHAEMRATKLRCSTCLTETTL